MMSRSRALRRGTRGPRQPGLARFLKRAATGLLGTGALRAGAGLDWWPSFTTPDLLEFYVLVAGLGNGFRLYVHCRQGYMTKTLARVQPRRRAQRQLRGLVALDALLSAAWLGSAVYLMRNPSRPLEGVTAFGLLAAVMSLAVMTVSTAETAGYRRGSEAAPFCSTVRRLRRGLRRIPYLGRWLASFWGTHTRPREVSAFVMWACVPFVVVALVNLAPTLTAAAQLISGHLKLGAGSSMSTTSTNGPKTKTRETVTTDRHSKPTSVGAKVTPKPIGQGGLPPTNTAATSTSDQIVSWRAACGEAAPLPGYDDPPAEAEEFRNLYFGQGQPGGGAAAGCTGRTHHHLSTHPDVDYLIGRNSSGGEQSIAAVWQQSDGSYDGAIVIAPAIAVFWDQLNRYGHVKSLWRINAGDGDVVVLWTPVGTTVLIRSTKWDGNDASGYLRLDPPASDRWIAAMEAHHEWLWPIATDAPPGTHRFVLVHDPILKSPVESIEYTDHEQTGSQIDAERIKELAPGP